PGRSALGTAGLGAGLRGAAGAPTRGSTGRLGHGLRRGASPGVPGLRRADAGGVALGGVAAGGGRCALPRGADPGWRPSRRRGARARLRGTVWLAPGDGGGARLGRGASPLDLARMGGRGARRRAPGARRARLGELGHALALGPGLVPLQRGEHRRGADVRGGAARLLLAVPLGAGPSLGLAGAGARGGLVTAPGGGGRGDGGVDARRAPVDDAQGGALPLPGRGPARGRGRAGAGGAARATTGDVATRGPGRGGTRSHRPLGPAGPRSPRRSVPRNREGDAPGRGDRSAHRERGDLGLGRLLLRGEAHPVADERLAARPGFPARDARPALQPGRDVRGPGADRASGGGLQGARAGGAGDDPRPLTRRPSGTAGTVARASEIPSTDRSRNPASTAPAPWPYFEAALIPTLNGTSTGCTFPSGKRYTAPEAGAGVPGTNTVSQPTACRSITTPTTSPSSISTRAS